MGEIRRIRLTQGAIDNSYLNLHGHLDFFPPNSLGGSNRDEAGQLVTFHVAGLAEPIQTDIDETKRAVRSRGWVQEFVKAHKLRPGDVVALERLSEREYRIFPVRESGNANE